MRTALAFAVSTALLLAAEGAGANRPPAALSVSPARLTLTAPGSRRINLRNDGAERVVVDVARWAVAAGWLRIAPARVVLGPGRSAALTLRARVARGAEPGEHNLLVVLTTRPQSSSRVALRLRLGVRVKARIPGRIVRRVALGGLRLHRARGTRFMAISVANRGNVTVQLGGHVPASLYRRRGQVARLHLATRRALAPGARTHLALRYAGRLRGPVTAVVRIWIGSGVRLAERRYRIRL